MAKAPYELSEYNQGPFEATEAELTLALDTLKLQGRLPKPNSKVAKKYKPPEEPNGK